MIALKTGIDFLSSEKSFSLVTSDHDPGELMPLLKPKIGRGAIRTGAIVSGCEPELAPLNSSTLVNVQYQWQTQDPTVTDALKQLVMDFKLNLRKTESKLKQQGLDLVPLDLVSAGIQY